MNFNPSCDRCVLHDKAKHVCIPGRGSSDPGTIMFVGQAPGEQEDKQGKCFIGPAGQLLIQAINRFELKPVYLTNAAKCFPPGDRDPKPGEIEACRPYLEEEIARVRPKLIVAVGNIALRTLTGKTGITTWNGREVGTWDGKTKVVGLLHPAYILRYPKDLAKFEGAFREIRWLAGREKKPEGIAVERMKPFDAWAVIKTWKFAAFDFETSGKFKCDGGRLRTVAFSDGKRAVWFDFEETPSAAHFVMEEFLKSDIEKAAHNAAFEIRWCLDRYRKEPRNLTCDTMVMDHLLDENASHALDAVAAKHFQAPSWDVYPLLVEKGLTYETVDVETLGSYNGIDAYWTAKLAQKMETSIKKDLNLLRLYTAVALPMAKLCGRFEHRGVWVDHKWARKVDKIYDGRMKEASSKLLQFEVVRKFVDRLASEKKDLNWNSAQQVGRLFFDRLKLPVVEETEGGKPSVREAALQRIRGQVEGEAAEILERYLEWKGLQTLRNNFLQKWPKFADADGIVRAGFNSAYVVTGRLSVTNPPLQAAPEDAFVRGIVSSRFEKGRICAADYKQLEMRLVASESDEKRLLEAFHRDEDVHDLTASLVFGPEFTKRQRSIAKRINFGIVYGVTSYTLAAEFNMAPEEAERIMVRFKRAYPAIFRWMHRQHEKVKAKGWIANRFGRVRRLEEVKHLDHWAQERVLRQAGNFPIASLGADITNTACVLVDRALRKAKFRSMLVHQVHDSLLVDAHPDEVATVPKLMKRVMEVEVMKRCPWLKVPLLVDVEVSRRWGGAKVADLRESTKTNHGS